VYASPHWARRHREETQDPPGCPCHRRRLRFYPGPPDASFLPELTGLTKVAEKLAISNGSGSQKLRRQLVPDRHAIVIIVVAGVLRLCAGTSLGFRPFDDTYITFRYAVKLAAGQGFVYNINEPVLGTMTPLGRTTCRVLYLARRASRGWLATTFR